MSKYIRKPIIIDAFQYDGDLMNGKGVYYVPEWAVHAYNKGKMRYDSFTSDAPPTELFIGADHVKVGDFVIRGVDGEIYPCKQELFKKEYKEIQVLGN